MLKLFQIVKENYFYIIAVILALIFFDLSSITKIINNIPENFKSGTIFYRFSTNNDETWISILERTEYYFSDLILWIKNFNFISFLNNIIQFTFDFLIYFTNYFMNFFIYLYLFFYIFISKDVYETKYTKSARAFVRYISFLSKLKDRIILFVNYLLENKKKIALSIVILSLSKGLLISIISEIAIFIYYYALSSFNLNLHLILWYMLKAIILFIYIKVPLWLGIIVSIIIIWKLALYRAEIVKENNHNNLKAFAKFDLPFQTIVNGVPGVGKTRLLVQLALAIEETYYDELEETIKSIEAQFPETNFGEVISNKYLHINNFKEHYQVHKLLNRKTSSIMTVPFALLDPYNESLSHQLDFNYIRPNVRSTNAPLEKYTVLVISELDKEYNSHYSKKEVGEDGLHVFFGIGSHWFERKSKILIDYQISTQVPLNIRGNAEMFIKIEDTRYKMPFLLKAFSLPFKWLYQLCEKIISSYESYKVKLAKYSQRNSKSIRKRYDYTLIYAILRHLLYYLEKALMFFRNFLYIRFYCNIVDIDNKPIKKVKINVNNFDESWRGSRLYDSTFLSKAYKDKKAKGFDWDKIPSWTSLTPNQEELSKVHSRFIDSAFNNNLETGENYDDEKSIIEFN